MNILEALKTEFEIRQEAGQDIAKLPELIAHIAALEAQLKERDEKIERLKGFWKPIIEKFESRFPNAGNANTIALTSLTEAFDVYCKNEELEAKLADANAKIEGLEAETAMSRHVFKLKEAKIEVLKRDLDWATSKLVEVLKNDGSIVRGEYFGEAKEIRQRHGLDKDRG